MEPITRKMRKFWRAAAGIIERGQIIRERIPRSQNHRRQIFARNSADRLNRSARGCNLAFFRKMRRCFPIFRRVISSISGAAGRFSVTPRRACSLKRLWDRSGSVHRVNCIRSIANSVAGVIVAFWGIGRWGINFCVGVLIKRVSRVIVGALSGQGHVWR